MLLFLYPPFESFLVVTTCVLLPVCFEEDFRKELNWLTTLIRIVHSTSDCQNYYLWTSSFFLFLKHGEKLDNHLNLHRATYVVRTFSYRCYRTWTVAFAIFDFISFFIFSRKRDLTTYLLFLHFWWKNNTWGLLCKVCQPQSIVSLTFASRTDEHKTLDFQNALFLTERNSIKGQCCQSRPTPNRILVCGLKCYA
jgi:hypothetical protein